MNRDFRLLSAAVIFEKRVVLVALDVPLVLNTGLIHDLTTLRRPENGAKFNFSQIIVCAPAAYFDEIDTDTTSRVTASANSVCLDRFIVDFKTRPTLSSIQ